MSDFKTSKDFKKGRLSEVPYQDPTMLSFVLMFDFDNAAYSPLLAGAAEKYYDKLIKEAGNGKSFFEERKEDLTNFIKALKTINRQAPWYWQSLAGLEKILQYDTSKPYFGGDDSTLTIGTLESINLAIAGLMQLYRKAAFDEHRWSWILPANLRKFKLYVYVTEVRAIKNFDELGLNPLKKKAIPITGTSHRPYFMASLGYCEFDITSGTTPFADLTKNPEGQATNEIVIKYESLHEVQARSLQGIVTTKYNTDKISPAPDFEEQNTSLTARVVSGLEDLASQAVDDLKRLSQDKKLEVEQLIRNTTTNRFQNPGNVFKNFVRRVDDATDINQQTRNIGTAVQDNIYGNTSGSTIENSLQDAAVRSLGNIYE